MTDWVTISSLATAGGTFALALATFASVRSGNRAARIAEQSLLARLRPVLVPSRPQDPPEKIGFADTDGHWVKVAGGHGLAEVTDEVIYLAISLRNIGSGIAVLHAWYFHPEWRLGDVKHVDLVKFHRLSRDLYIAAGDSGFWQGTFRNPSAPGFIAAKEAIDRRQPVMIDLLYGDHEGGQRVISRYTLTPGEDGDWLAAVSHHWNIDRDQPR